MLQLQVLHLKIPTHYILSHVCWFNMCVSKKKINISCVRKEEPEFQTKSLPKESELYEITPTFIMPLKACNIKKCATKIWPKLDIAIKDDFLQSYQLLMPLSVPFSPTYQMGNQKSLFQDTDVGNRNEQKRALEKNGHLKKTDTGIKLFHSFLPAADENQRYVNCRSGLEGLQPDPLIILFVSFC